MLDEKWLPPTWEEFIENFTILDINEVYTNRDVLVPLFRVKQMMEHYYKPERTCRNAAVTPLAFRCGKCGWFDKNRCDFNYCPNCGARVID